MHEAPVVDRVNPLSPARAWFAAQGWAPFPFQEEVWAAYRRGMSGLVHAATGMGKTYAAALPPMLFGATGAHDAPPPLALLWLTPLRALAADTGLALGRAAADLAPHWTIDVRTGDTTGAARARQGRQLPTALVTTPESLTLLLARADWRERFAHLAAVVVDEWHELMGTKRGVQAELALARLRSILPRLRVWGLSATLANLDDALACLVGPAAVPAGVVVRGLDAKTTVIDSLRPGSIERFPWAGHIGLRLLPQVVRAIERAKSTLVFTNVRSQTEIWYQAILEARPDWAGTIALHHGSLERDVRDWVEDGLRHERLRAVVCTSSLDLGVDYAPVEQVLQIGSPKGVARLLQRAGRSGHRPGAISRATIVPTQALELVEAAAARDAASARVPDARIARRHRIGIGTIVSEASITVRLKNGKALGHVEEDFIARLAPGDSFVFAGRALEFVRVREGHALFFYPFEGRLAHLGLATLFSYRLSRATPGTFSLTANDYGFGLLSPAPVALTLGELGRLLAEPDVEADILAGLNAAALARLRGSRALLTRPARPTPFAFPLLVEMFREELSTEALDARVARMVADLERAAQLA